MKKIVLNKSLVLSVKSLIHEARKSVVRNVNTAMLITHYEVGRMIVEEEQHGKGRADYGKEVIKHLSEELIKEFGKGYSADNLEKFRKFYSCYHSRISESVIRKSGAKIKSESVIRISQPYFETFALSFQLSWTHYFHLLKIENESERNFYEIEASANNWSVREMQRQINAALYERLSLSKDKKGIKKLSSKGQILERSTDVIKDPYVLEFLDLKEDNRYSESDLETAIINKLEHFMLELGKGFLFEGRQRRFTMEGHHFYVDLVFYNRLLKCFVLIDLKIGELTHQDIGQMQMYVNYYDRKIKTKEENPTVGIILCRKDNKTVIEYTLPEGNKQIFSREYKLYLPSKEELKKQLE
jgi:predicted nuclease of restriction endonuclease-like (RecB) superfamily